MKRYYYVFAQGIVEGWSGEDTRDCAGPFDTPEDRDEALKSAGFTFDPVTGELTEMEGELIFLFSIDDLGIIRPE